MTIRFLWWLRFAFAAIGAAFTYCSCENSRTDAAASHDAANVDASTDASQADSNQVHDSTLESHAPDGAPEGGLAWIGNLAYWKAMPDANGCEVHFADPAHLPTTSRRWTDCGSGCQAASALSIPGLPTDVTRNPTGVRSQNGSTYVRTYSVLPGPDLWVLARLLDGAVLGAIRFGEGSKCFGYTALVDAAEMAPVVKSETGVRVARYSLTAPADPTWSPWSLIPPPYTTGFAASSFWAITTLSGAVSVADWPSGVLTSVDSDSVTFSSAARDDVAVWATKNGANKGVVKAYSPSSKKVWTLVDQPGLNASVVALTPTRVFWVTVTGPFWTSGGYASAALWSSDLPAGATTVAPVKVADLQAIAGMLNLHVGGDHAATVACFPGPDGGLGSGVDACPVLVLSTSTGNQWKLPSRPDKIFHTVLSLSDEELLVGESNNPSDPTASQRIDSLVRLRLDSLDALQNGWAK